MKNLYYFHPSLVVRTPANPFDREFDEGTILRQATNPAFAEALYLASPSLHDDSQKLHLDEGLAAKKKDKVYHSLARYYARMSSRCTPFALFAGCGVVQWGEASRITRAGQPDRRHTRLDMYYLCALAQQLAGQPSVQARLRYFPNSSLYSMGEEIRYTEFRYENAELLHQISAVAASEPLQQALAHSRSGTTRLALAHTMTDDHITLAEALDFVDELIEGQILMSELEPTVTGPEFLPHLLQVLARLQAEQPSEEIRAIEQILEGVQADLAALDEPGTVNAKSAYERITQALQVLEAPIEPNKLFQTDLVYDLAGSTLNQDIQPQLLEALEALTYLDPPAGHDRLAQFVPLFYARYEEREVPLLEALDNESGISYSEYGQNSYAALVHDLAPPALATTGRSISQSGVHTYLYEKLRAADRNGDYTVAITTEELRQFAPLARPLPASLSVLFRLGGAGQIVLESVGGSSAANLLGRFAHAAPEIDQLVRDLTRLEQQHNPDVRFAEVCHLPASRMGNILLRPHFRELEIPYLAQSTLPPEQQVALQDLYLSVRRGQLVLRSRKLNQVIIPRLSSAHNYTRQALPVYQFLCDLQTQGVQSHLNFSWKSISFYTKFLPRLVHGQVVLQVASWQLDAADFQPLLSATAAELAPRIQAFCAQWRLPQLFTLADGDNELLVDTQNPVTVRAWLDSIKTRPGVLLKEFLFDAAHCPVTDAAGRPYISQFVASLVRRTASYQALPTPAASPQPVQREFALGSEWFYTKLYCGQKVANRLLIELVKPLTEALHATGLIDRWFFIRYADPDNHLRIRLHLPDTGRIGELIHTVNEFLEPFVAAGYVWRTQTDTYCRELERYGPHTIGAAEALFCADSAHAVALFEHSAADPDPDTTHWLWGLRLIDSLLDAFAYSLDQKIGLLRHSKEAFAQEFRLDKELKVQLDTKYRLHRSAIQQVLRRADGAAPTADEPVGLLAYHRTAPVRQAARQLLQLAQHGQLAVPLDQLLGSYIHMLLNRLISGQARLHELVIYDFLHRHYLSEQVRGKAAISCSLP